jgi:hypothetical protein
MLLRVLSRFRVWWDWDQWPGVTVAWEFQRPTSRLRVEYEGVDASGEKYTETYLLEGHSLPSRAPFKVTITPKYNYLEIPGIRTLTCQVFFRLDSGAREDVLECGLMENSVANTEGKVTDVP